MKIVLNDESIANDYGFKISNKGIDLSRFQNNNVLLMKHKSGDLAIGNVEDLVIEGSQLVGNVKFDKEDTDEEVVRLISKYERGVMKGFSMGVMINEFKTQMIAKNEAEEIATASELYEVSCETLQSNKNSVTVKLMNNTEGLFKLGFNDKEKKFLNQNKNDKMDLTKLASVLGLKETATLAEIETAAAMQALQLTQLQTSQLDSLTTEAVAKGVVTEETKASFKKLAAIDFASAKEMVTGFKTLTVSHKAEKTTVAPEQSVDLLQLLTKLATQGGITNDPKDRTQWNFDQWSKQDSDGLMKLKAVDSAKYNALIEKHRAENAHHLG